MQNLVPDQGEIRYENEEMQNLVPDRSYQEKIRYEIQRFYLRYL
ncbi:hypothetical protein [Litchfieldia alkalitelluris]|nr:hypothetical protein [Litchfieldia alkalitelluris]